MSYINEKPTMQSKNLVELKDNLIEIIEKEKGNTKLIGYINGEFVKKGLLYYVPQQIFEGDREIDELNNIELMCFTKSIFEYTKNKIINPELYFSNTEMIAYDTWVNVPEDYTDYIIYPDAIRISPRSFIVNQKANHSSEMREHKKYIYFKPAQRPAKNVLRKGILTSKKSVNKQGILEMEERMSGKGETLFPTQIAWGVLMLEGKKIQVSFTPIDGNRPNVGTLKIIPNWDKNDVNYTPVIINDGYHRFTAQANAYDKHLIDTGEELEYNLSAIVNIMTIEESKQYVLDSFKRNFADENELKVMELTNDNKFVENIIEKSEILKENTGTIIKSIKGSNKLTSKDILQNAIKLTKFEINDEIESEIQSTKCAKIIDLIINRLCKEYYNNNFNEMKKSYLLLPNMFIGYIAIANFLRNDSKYISKIVSIVEELYLQDEKEISKLKLKNKDCNIKNVFDYFSHIKEVI